jgi:hypothetical protein
MEFGIEPSQIEHILYYFNISGWVRFSRGRFSKGGFGTRPSYPDPIHPSLSGGDAKGNTNVNNIFASLRLCGNKRLIEKKAAG